MRWEDERYVRFYTRDTPEWLALSWPARGLFGLILRVVDRAGVLHVGKVGQRGLSVMVHAPWAEIEAPLRELLGDGCLVWDEARASFLIPNYLQAQECSQSDRARKRASRERARDVFGLNRATQDAIGTEVTKRDHTESQTVTQEVTKRDEMSQAVTGGHTESHAVTPCRAVPCRAVEASAEPQAAAAPPMAVLPCAGKGPKEYAVARAELETYRPAFPGVDLEAELQKARVWLVSHPRRRKTHGGVPAFLNNWFTTAQNKGGARRVDEYEERMRRVREQAEREPPEPDDRGGRRNGQAATGASAAGDVPAAATALSTAVGKLLGAGGPAGGVQNGATLELGLERGRAEAARSLREPRDDPGRNGAPGDMPV